MEYGQFRETWKTFLMESASSDTIEIPVEEEQIAFQLYIDETKEQHHKMIALLRDNMDYTSEQLMVVLTLPPAPSEESSFASLDRGNGTKEGSLARDSKTTEDRQSEEGTDEPIDQPIRIANPTSKQSAMPTKKRTLPKDENASGTGVVEKRAKVQQKSNRSPTAVSYTHLTLPTKQAV